MIATLFSLTLAAQQAQLKYVRAFPGGSMDQYVRFIGNTKAVANGINVFAEKTFEGFGPARALIYTDKTVRLEPPLPSLFKVGKTGFSGYLSCSILPSPYCRSAGQPDTQSGEDVIRFLQITSSKDNALGIQASLRLGNNLSPLRFTTQVHPFFNDMWVNVRYTGNWTPDILDAIAATVGATVIKEKGPPDTYRLEPNVEEIRARALATLDYFTPGYDSDAGIYRERLRYRLIHDSPMEFMKRWVNAAKKDEMVTLANQSWADDVRKYRDLVLGEIAKGNKTIGKYAIEDCKTMPIHLQLQRHLDFSVVLEAPGGVPIFL